MRLICTAPRQPPSHTTISFERILGCFSIRHQKTQRQQRLSDRRHREKGENFHTKEVIPQNTVASATNPAPSNAHPCARSFNNPKGEKNYLLQRNVQYLVSACPGTTTWGLSRASRPRPTPIVDLPRAADPPTSGNTFCMTLTRAS